MKNLELAKHLLDQLAQQGVTEICLCTGARNAPIVSTLDSFDFKIHSFFDERSAAFFAIGRARALGQPVAVTTTSGSAVSELLPACIEAFYSKLPLVLLTADRPKSFRGSGSPQSIEQLSMLSSHVERQYDIDGRPQEIRLARGPVHVNVCFGEPLLGDASFETRPASKLIEKPLVIVSGLNPEQSESLIPALKLSGCAVVLEGTSQLSGHSQLQDLEIPSWRVSASSFENYFDSVIRIGNVPTLRLFRDLDLGLSHVPVQQFSDLPWTGLDRESKGSVQPLAEAEKFLKSKSFEKPSVSLLIEPRFVTDKLTAQPMSELNAVRVLKSQVPYGSQVFLGNSLPIREWDAVPAETVKTGIRVLAQRGVNGIDGLVSHFLGSCQTSGENILILGDLSFLYDCSGLWAASGLPEDLSFKIVVLNNSGGRIFRRLFELPLLEMQHSSEMKPLSEAWGLPHILVEGEAIKNFSFDGLPERCLIEVKPDLLQSDAAWKSIRELYV